MNISPDNISGECNLKCSYSFNYPVSNCTAINNGYSISLSYDNSSIPAVTFNNENYSVIGILIVAPSIHLFNGSPADGELIIIHINPAGKGSMLNVCIPIVSNSLTPKSSNILETIINATTNQAPATGESTNITLTDFTLNSLVPVSSFYSYTASTHDTYIVYGIDQSLSINLDTLNGLNSILTQPPASFGLTFPSGPLLFVNSEGPTNGKGGSDNEIYISCKPTGNSEQTDEVSFTKPSITNDLSMNGILNNPIMIFLLASLFTIIVMFALYYLINYLSNGSAAKIGSNASNKK